MMQSQGNTKSTQVNFQEVAYTSTYGYEQLNKEDYNMIKQILNYSIRLCLFHHNRPLEMG